MMQMHPTKWHVVWLAVVKTHMIRELSGAWTRLKETNMLLFVYLQLVEHW